jgi:hypothetical protein
MMEILVALSAKTPPQPLPTRGRGFNATLPAYAWGSAVPQVFSPLVGEMAGRPEGDCVAEAQR